MEHYGQKEPKEIFLSKIKTMPIAMYVGAQDPLATPYDTKWASEQLGNVIHYEVMDNFDHGAFTLGLDMSYMNRVLENIAEYNHPTFKSVKTKILEDENI